MGHQTNSDWFIILAVRNGGLGVAIFFAISGFLITNKVLQPDLNSHRFSTWSFYSQRIGRIFPWLLLMFLSGEGFCLLGIPGFTFEQTKIPFLGTVNVYSVSIIGGLVISQVHLSIQCVFRTPCGTSSLVGGLVVTLD